MREGGVSGTMLIWGAADGVQEAVSRIQVFGYQRRPDGGTLPRRLDVVAEVT